MELAATRDYEVAGSQVTVSDAVWSVVGERLRSNDEELFANEADLGVRPSDREHLGWAKNGWCTANEIRMECSFFSVDHYFIEVLGDVGISNQAEIFVLILKLSCKKTTVQCNQKWVLELLQLCLKDLHLFNF